MNVEAPPIKKKRKNSQTTKPPAKRPRLARKAAATRPPDLPSEEAKKPNGKISIRLAYDKEPPGHVPQEQLVYLPSASHCPRCFKRFPNMFASQYRTYTTHVCDDILEKAATENRTVVLPRPRPPTREVVDMEGKLPDGASHCWRCRKRIQDEHAWCGGLEDEYESKVVAAAAYVSAVERREEELKAVETAPAPALSSPEWKDIYEKMMITCDFNCEEAKHTKQNEPSLVFGQLRHVGVDYLIKTAGLEKTDVFLDFGSGIGNVCVHVAARTGCRAFGVEIREDLHVIAKKVEEQYNAVRAEHPRGKELGSVKLTQGNGLCIDKADLQEVSVVYMNNLRFNSRLMVRATKALTRGLPRGARILTTERLPVGRRRRHDNRINPTTTKTDVFSSSFEHYESADGSVVPYLEYIPEEEIFDWTTDIKPLYLYTIKDVWRPG